MMGLSENDVLQGATNIFVPDSPDMELAGAGISGFLIQDTPSGKRVQYLPVFTAENPEGDPPQAFYSYTPDVSAKRPPLSLPSSLGYSIFR